ncbi:MAG: cellulase family glycosylhydrolase [Chloroflexi bacterium]|nr:cellulase family glycosylhydrolase [Chloroflexota bacterium]
MPSQTILPRWRGFNLLEFFTIKSSGDVQEDDFRWMADWGFNFVRLPMCYTLWIEDDHPRKTHEPMLRKVDRAVELGRRYGIHVCLNFHRAPGFSVNPERTEPYNLWQDQAALDDFCFHWRLFAGRYRGIPTEQLSFNLVNEPIAPRPDIMTREDHERVMRTTVAAIREIDPIRLIILDGLSWGNWPCPELANLGVAQSCRAYLPMGISHYKASWVNGETYPQPQWPGGWNNGEYWNRDRLAAHYQQWADLAAQGVGVHCGEGGAFIHTPHDIVLRWLRDVLAILRSYNIGYALWNLRGGFGILDSDRADVTYEDWHGHKLDRQLLNLLQAF